MILLRRAASRPNKILRLRAVEQTEHDNESGRSYAESVKHMLWKRTCCLKASRITFTPAGGEDGRSSHIRGYFWRHLRMFQPFSVTSRTFPAVSVVTKPSNTSGFCASTSAECKCSVMTAEKYKYSTSKCCNMKKRSVWTWRGFCRNVLCYIVYFTLNETFIYKRSIVLLLRRFETRIWGRHLSQKLFIDSINQLRSSFHTIRRHFMCSFFMIKHLSGFRWEPDVTDDSHNNKFIMFWKEKLCDKLKSSFASSCARGPSCGPRLPGNTLVLV